MAKGDVYYLIDDRDGYINAKFEQTDDFMEGNCYSAYSWYEGGVPDGWEFFASVYCKWDSCTHWRFKGEDYNPEDKSEHDSYYHICGSYTLLNHVRLMCFIWKIAPMIISEDHFYKYNKFDGSYIRDEYFDSEEIKQLTELMLKGYTIKKGDKENDQT